MKSFINQNPFFFGGLMLLGQGIWFGVLIALAWVITFHW